jgi:hypothetical protein
MPYRCIGRSVGAVQNLQFSNQELKETDGFAKEDRINL